MATHDTDVIQRVKAFESERGIGPNWFEFQMLFGIRSIFGER